MIINHQYKFIFLKTSKTAGTSIEIAFSKFCEGSDDVVTPVSPADERIRRELGSGTAKNYFSPLQKYRGKDFLRLLIRGKKKMEFYNHMTAAETKTLVLPDIWSTYFKFCFERNPWDRLISHYFHLFRKSPRPSFSDYIFSSAPLSLKRRGHDVYTIDRKVAVDRVCRFENLEQELAQVCRDLGIVEGLVLPNAKGGTRKDRRPYQEFFGKAEREKAADMFSSEIALMDYQF